MKASKTKIVIGAISLILSLVAAREYTVKEERASLDRKIKSAKFDRDTAEFDRDMKKMSGDTLMAAELQVRIDEANKELERLKEIRKHLSQ